MIGNRTIFQSLFAEDTALEVTKPERRGRSEILKQKQNELIVCRYYYYAKLHGCTYEKSLEKLENEIFLAQRTLVNIINENVYLLRNLNTTKPSLNYFQKKYPFYQWVLLKN